MQSEEAGSISFHICLRQGKRNCHFLLGSPLPGIVGQKGYVADSKTLADPNMDSNILHSLLWEPSQKRTLNPKSLILGNPDIGTKS